MVHGISYVFSGLAARATSTDCTDVSGWMDAICGKKKSSHNRIAIKVNRTTTHESGNIHKAVVIKSRFQWSRASATLFPRPGVRHWFSRPNLQHQRHNWPEKDDTDWLNDRYGRGLACLVHCIVVTGYNDVGDGKCKTYRRRDTTGGRQQCQWRVQWGRDKKCYYSIKPSD